MTRSSCCRSYSRRSADASQRPATSRRTSEATIRAQKAAYRRAVVAHDSKGRVNPARFFTGLRRQLADDATVVLDDGNHTFLARSCCRSIAARTDLADRLQLHGLLRAGDDRLETRATRAQVVGIVGDGAFRMTAMELATATALGSASCCSCSATASSRRSRRRQELPYNRKTCTVLGPLDIAGVAQATGATFLRLSSDADIDTVISDAFARARDSASRCSSTSRSTIRSARASPRASSRRTSSASTSRRKRGSSGARSGAASAADPCANVGSARALSEGARAVRRYLPRVARRRRTLLWLRTPAPTGAELHKTTIASAACGARGLDIRTNGLRGTCRARSPRQHHAPLAAARVGERRLPGVAMSSR